MNVPPKRIVVCPDCGTSFERNDLEKVCSNCFACTGCEIYICPKCEKEMVIKPIGEPRRRTRMPEEYENRGNGNESQPGD